MEGPKMQGIDLISCCASAYSHPAARWLMGESFHPGGVALTSRLAELMGLGAGSRVLDLGCGRGASAVHLAKTMGWHVIGVTPEEEGVAAAREAATKAGVGTITTFSRGAAGDLPDDLVNLDGAVMECVLSIVPDKPAALADLHHRLRPGGRLGLTDVTVSGPLPDDLAGVLASVGCVGDALSLDAYRNAVQAAGLQVIQAQDLQETAASFLSGIKAKLLVAEIGVKLGKLPIELSMVQEAKGYLKRAMALVAEGTLSYGLVVANRP